MDRHWLLTWTTYGTWLPGDERGFVSFARQPSGNWEIHNIPGTPYDANDSQLKTKAKSLLRSKPVYLTAPQAKVVLGKLHETAKIRQWDLLAAAVMRNHAHVVVGVPGDPDPDDLLRDFKCNASGELNLKFARKADWWTRGGSTRKLPDEPAIVAGMRYVENQQHPLAMWIDRDWLGRAFG